MESKPSPTSKPQPEASHPCELGGKCTEAYEVLEKHDTCARGRIDAHQCLRCQKIFDIRIVR